MTIHVSFVDVIPAGLRPSFRLRTLTLGSGGSDTAVAHAVAHAVLASSATSLLTLNLVTLPQTQQPSFRSSLPLVATSLQSLTVFDPLPALGPVLSSFTRLSSLSLFVRSLSEIAGYDAALTALIRSIESIKLYASCALDGPFLRALIQSMRGAAGWMVTRISLEASKPKLEAMVDGCDFIRVCSERGIDIELRR